jgi:uncharacterized protein YegL
MAKRKGGGGGGLILLVVIGFALYKFIGSTQQSAPSTPGSTSGGGTPATSYALNAANESWPPLEEGAAIKVSMDTARASNYYVVLDGSGSMRESHCSGDKEKIQAAVTALDKFVAAVPADANLGLAVFDSAGISERVPLGVGNRDAFLRALDRVRAEGGTPLRSSIELGYRRLLQQGRQQLGYGEYHLVVVTDGMPDPRSEDPTGAVQDILAKTPVVLHTIGFCLGDDHVLNQPGRSFYVAADSPEQLQQGLTAVLAEAPSFDATKFGN